MQNVGAYGVEISELLVDVDLYDRRTAEVRTRVPAAALGMGYRTSALKGRDVVVVLRIRLALAPGPSSAPIRYPELGRIRDNRLFIHILLSGGSRLSAMLNP